MGKRIPPCVRRLSVFCLFLAILAVTVCVPSPAYAQGALTNGGNHAGSISAPGDIDEWTFTASIGDAILLSVGEVLPAGPDPSFRPWIRLRGPDGLEIESSVGLLAAQINTTAPLSGTYTVLVRDYIFAGSGLALGDYLLHFVRIPGDVSVPGGDEGGPLTNGGNHAATIHRADLDVWTFTAAKDDAIILTVGEVLDSEVDPEFRPWIRLYGPDGAALGSNVGVLAAALSATAPLSGTYTVVIADYAFSGEGARVGDYLLHLVKTPGTLTVPIGDDGGPLTNGANHPGRIGAPGETPTLHRGDVDAWTFTAAKDDAIILTVGEVLDSEVDPEFRPWIRLYGPDGASLGSNVGVLAAALSATAPLSGTYTVVIADYAFSGEGARVGDYLLHLVKTPGALTVPIGDDGGAMTNATNHPGRIGAPGDKPTLHRADLDAWTFVGAQGNTLTVTITEVLPGEVDPEFRPWIRLFGPTGTLVGSNVGLLTTSIDVIAPVSGLYTVVVADYAFAGEGARVGDYVVRVDGAVDSGEPPTSAGDSFQTAMGTTLTIPAPGVLANDTTNGGGALTAVLASSVTNGSLALAANGGFVYTPAAGFVGTATFTYHAQNNAGPGNVVTVSITVTSLPPTTNGDAFVTSSDTPLNVPAPGVLANDAANGGGALTAELVSPAANGILNLAANGSFAYTPNPGFAGIDGFSYRAASSVGPGNIASVTITVDTTEVQPPSDLYVASVVGNTVTIRWTPPVVGPAATSFVLEGGVSPGAVQASIAMTQDPAFTFQAPNGAFFIRVHTIAGAERSAAPSNEVPLFVNVPVPPSPPANLLGLVNGSSLGLAWRNTFGGGAPTGLILDVTGTLATSIPLGLTDTFAFNGVPPGTYTLSLRAVNAAGVSVSSNPIPLTFPGACSGAPLAPENFVAYRTGNTINVMWDPAASGPAPTAYLLSVTGSLTASIPTPSRALSGGVGPGSYSLSVVAVNPCGSSAPTPAQVVVVP